MTKVLVRTEGLVHDLARKATDTAGGRPPNGEFPRVHGEVFKWAREEMGLSREGVAEMLGIHPQTVYRIETYASNPHPLVTYALCVLYGLELKEVLA